MPRQSTYKLQGNGKHSYTVTITDDNGNVIWSELLLADSNNYNPASDVKKAVQLTDFELLKLKQLLGTL